MCVCLSRCLKFLKGQSPESYCPDGFTYKNVEPFCKENKDCPSNTTSIEEACCPIHKTKDTEIIPLYFPFTTQRKCSDYDAPPLRNVFCRRDIGKWAILGEFRVNGTENVVPERYLTAPLPPSVS
ncbi:hypothetical protein L3Y34_000291 [Caenorhabditis briggsae]|uniref:Domain of unknown function DX domain-containing protein n=1 Tax=Caenorhabditis briggsae TaxID=6238 RepID=A0AAE9D8W1_CAEBR|nr:hypothetical protein L3Y34_000291 [Caenorhabditis briggsae]